MTEPSGIGPLERRRGVAPEIFLIWIILAAVGGAIAWGMYGNDVRSILELPPAGAPTHWVSTQTNQTQSTIISANEIVGLVKDLQASQQRAADDVRTVLQLLTSEQAPTKSLSDAVAALQAKVDAIQRPVMPVAKKSAPSSAPRKPSAPPPPSASPVQDQPEPEPSAPTSIVRPEGR
jgi:hypothetical protein